MPGNEVGDRVHNFFAQDNLPQGQHHSQVSDGSWPSLNGNFWAGNQKQVAVSSSSPRNYNSFQSDFGRGDNGHPLHLTHGLDFTQTTLRTDYAKIQPQSQAQNLNGYMYGRQTFPSRHDEVNLLGVDPALERHNVNPRGLFMFESQQGGISENVVKNAVRSNTSDTSVSFDLFGGQQHMNGQQSSVLQGLPQQQSGFADMQQLQQQLMFRKMQELQRQKGLQQLDVRQQNVVNQVSSYASNASSGHSQSFINSNPNVDASGYPWGELTTGNTNSLQRASPSMQGTSSGLVFSPEQLQTPRSEGFGHQQLDQSLYGFPISNSRGNINQLPLMATNKTSIQQMPAYKNSFLHQYAVSPNQVTMQHETLPSRQDFQGKNLHDNASGQMSNSGMNVNNSHLLNPLQQDSSVHEFQGTQELMPPSELLQDKKAIDDAVSLDPAEEKILFGSDDNMWDAFGSDTIMGEGAPNLSDGNAFFNGLPSIQSGRWSALMQSAVAETSSNGIGLQEELVGLSCQNPGLAAGAHQSSRHDGGEKRQTSFGQNLPTSPAVNFESNPLSDGANTNKNFHNAMGFQQYGQDVEYNHGERLQFNSSKTLNPQSSGGSKLFNHKIVQKSHAEGSESHGISSRSLEMNGRSSSPHWSSQQIGSSQLVSKANNWNARESEALSGDRAYNFNRSEHSMEQSNDWKKGTHEETSYTNSIWKVNPTTKSCVDLKPAKSSLGSPQMMREGFDVNAAVPTLSIGAQVREDTGQFPSNIHPNNYWEHVDSSIKFKRTEGLERLQHNLNKGPQASESSLNSSDKEELRMHEVQSSDRKENSNSSNHSNIPHLVDTLTYAGDSGLLRGGRKKSSNQVGRRASAPRKFQYHPMGDLDEDVERSYEKRQGNHLQAMSLQHSSGLKGQDQGYFEQSKIFGQVPKSAADTGKGHVPDQQGEAKRCDEACSMGAFPGYMPNMFGSADRSSGLSAPNSLQPSKNMLELLNKVDQSREDGTMKHFNPSEQDLSSEIRDAEPSDGSIDHLQRNQVSNSQVFGFQLAPPLQRFSAGNHASTMSYPTVHFSSSTQTKIRDKGHSDLTPPHSVQSLPSPQKMSHEELKNDSSRNLGQTGNETSLHRMSGNFSSALSSGSPCLRSQTPSHSMMDSRGDVAVTHFDNLRVDKNAPDVKQADESCSSILGGQHVEGSLPNSAGYAEYNNASLSDPNRTTSVRNPLESDQPSVRDKFDGASSKMMSNLWTNVSAQQHLLGTQAHKFHANLPHARQSNNVESISSSWQNIENQDAEKRGTFSSESKPNFGNLQGFVCRDDQLNGSSPQNVSTRNIDLVQKMNEQQGNESLIRHTSDVSVVKPASTQRDLEAFGRSLKPNTYHQSFSLLNQVRAMNDSDSDPNNRGSKRLKGPNNFLGGQKVVQRTGQSNESNNMVADSTVRDTTVSSSDSRVSSFSGPVGNGEPSQPAGIPSRDMLTFRQNESQSYSHVKAKQAQSSPQMAPSWFNKYGTFGNGQILPKYDLRNGATVKTVEQSFDLGNFSSSLATDKSKELAILAADTGQMGVITHDSTPASVSIELLSSPLTADVSNQISVASRPKKRKSLHPWHKEVSKGFQYLLAVSLAEAEWAKAANRLIDKVIDAGEVNEDTGPGIRSRKRIVLTTQLMQLLLRPPPATILSADARSFYNSISYFVARLTLGDACSLVSSVHSSSDASHGESNLIKASERNDDHHLSEVVENFMSRARKLEVNLLSMDKKVSILDLRMECQDLEKFSVINRFAKFHGQGQLDASSDTAANGQKAVPQRYVTAVPLPKNLPDSVQCLSL